MDEPPGVQNLSSWPSRMPPDELQQLAQRDAQRRLELARPRHVARQRIDRHALGLLGAHRGEPVGAVGR